LDIKRVTVKIPKDTHVQLKIQAATKDMTLEQVINEAVKMYIQSHCKAT